jgi:N-acetylglucosaminyldiphosphoundecaprenol N-acetyl-beta-D-mannosaminyltransferase
MSVERHNVLGVGISVINLETALQAIQAAVAERRKGYVCVTGVHGVTEAQTDPEFRRILNHAFLNTPDGMPMVWLGRWRGFRQIDRVYGPDLMAAVCEASRSSGATHFLYGGGPGLADELKVCLERKFPGIRVVGTYSPPFRALNEVEAQDLARRVAEVRPDYFWVGLSTPKQEKFMAEYLPQLETMVMFGVGAAFDFHAGRVRQAPRWIQRSGMEWFYRTCQEPRRLWWRYFRNNPLFLWRITGQLLGFKKYTLE